MNNLKFIYYNIDTIDKVLFETTLFNLPNCESHIEIKSGILLVNYNGTAKELYEATECVVHEKNILIYDLDDSRDAYWGFMNNKVWEWIRNNRS